jgi:hypothetical protein
MKISSLSETPQRPGQDSGLESKAKQTARDTERDGGPDVEIEDNRQLQKIGAQIRAVAKRNLFPGRMKSQASKQSDRGDWLREDLPEPCLSAALWADRESTASSMSVESMKQMEDREQEPKDVHWGSQSENRTRKSVALTHEQKNWRRTTTARTDATETEVKGKTRIVKNQNGQR